MAEGECLLLALLGLGECVSGLLTGGGVHIEVHEEDLGVTQLLTVTAFILFKSEVFDGHA